jgi:hypothetical protein
MLSAPMSNVKSGVGGWLLALCGVLLVWQPLRFGLILSVWLDALAVRGVPLGLVLILQLVVTAFGIAAGLALAGRRPSAVVMAKAALVATAAMDLFVYSTPYAPNNRTPGETPIYIAVSVGWAAGWFLYLVRSRRVKNTY